MADSKFHDPPVKNRTYSVIDKYTDPSKPPATEVYNGFNRNFEAINLDHVVLYTVDGEVQVLAIDNPKRVSEVLRYLNEQECGVVSLIGAYTRV